MANLFTMSFFYAIFASMKDILRLIRPKQWLKNVFVLVPMFFGGALTDGATVFASLVAFLAFCFIASLN